MELTSLHKFLNEEEIVQFHDALESHIEENENVHELLINLLTIMGNIVQDQEMILNNQRIIINLTSGYGEYGNRQPLVQDEGS